MIAWLSDEDTPFPPSARALGPEADAPGLLAAGGKLTPTRLEAAYRLGIFPWYSSGQPPLWWSPDPRMVLPVDEFVLHRSLRKVMTRELVARRVDIRVDTAFDTVISACAQASREGQSGTWILSEMQAAYRQWHRLGTVHSVETWWDGELAGGLYCVAIGRMIFGESMFSARSDASKMALAALVVLARRHGVRWIDCQQNTRHLASMGAREVSRAAFEAHVAEAVAQADGAAWTYDREDWHDLLPGLAKDA